MTFSFSVRVPGGNLPSPERSTIGDVARDAPPNIHV
jgi:hypothetical protein